MCLEYTDYLVKNPSDCYSLVLAEVFVYLACFYPETTVLYKVLCLHFPQPSPPPLKVPTVRTSVNLPICKKKSWVPQFGSMKENHLQLKAEESISLSTNLHSEQQLTKSSFSNIAESEQKGRNQNVQSVQVSDE